MEQLYRRESDTDVQLQDQRTVPESWAYGEQHDNDVKMQTRYTVTGGKPSHGMIYLSGEDVALEPVDVAGFLRRGVEHAAEQVAKWADFNAVLMAPADVDEYEKPQRRQRAPKRALTPEFLRDVAKVHAEQSDTMRRTQGVAQKYGVKVATAQGWVDRARREGYV